MISTKAMIVLQISLLLGLSIIITPSSATSNFVFGECSPGKDSCHDCYISLAQHLFQSDENVFNLSRAFFPPETNTPDFVVVRYHLQNSTYNNTKTWFWGVSALYFVYPIATFQFLSLFFGKPKAFWGGEVDVTLNATECEGAKNEHLTLLTQRLKIYVEQYNIRPSIDDTYQAEAVDGVALNHLYTEKMNQLIIIVVCIQTLGVMMTVAGVVMIMSCMIKSTDKRNLFIKEIKHRSTISKQAFLTSLSINGVMFILYAIAMDGAAIFFQLENKTFLSDTKDDLCKWVLPILYSLPFIELGFDLFALIFYICAIGISTYCCCKNLNSALFFNMIPSLLGPLLGLINHSPFIAIAYIHDSYYASSIFVYYMVIFFICFVAVHLTIRACLRTQLPKSQKESNIWSYIFAKLKKINACIFHMCSTETSHNIDITCQTLCPVVVSIFLLLFLMSVVVIVICYLIIIPINGSVSGATHQLIVFYQTIIIFLGIFITYRTVLYKKEGSLKSAIRNRRKPLRLKHDTEPGTKWNDLPGVEKTKIYHEMVLDLVEHYYKRSVVDIASTGTSAESSTQDTDSTSTTETITESTTQDESNNHRWLSQIATVPERPAASAVIAVPATKCNRDTVSDHNVRIVSLSGAPGLNIQTDPCDDESDKQYSLKSIPQTTD